MSNHLQHPDRRTQMERAADLTDGMLFDVYHSSGLLEASDTKPYTREAVLNIARNAFLEGVDQKTRDPEGLSEFISRFNSLISKSSDDTVQKAH
jgi:hypothetical protein